MLLLASSSDRPSLTCHLHAWQTIAGRCCSLDTSNGTFMTQTLPKTLFYRTGLSLYHRLLQHLRPLLYCDHESTTRGNCYFSPNLSHSIKPTQTRFHFFCIRRRASERSMSGTLSRRGRKRLNGNAWAGSRRAERNELMNDWMNERTKLQWL